MAFSTSGDVSIVSGGNSDAADCSWSANSDDHSGSSGQPMTLLRWQLQRRLLP